MWLFQNHLLTLKYNVIISESPTTLKYNVIISESPTDS